MTDFTANRTGAPPPSEVINGGRIHGEQIKVEQPTLFQNRDYPVLTDYRAMFAGLFKRMYGLDAASVQRIFPGVKPAQLGLV